MMRSISRTIIKVTLLVLFASNFSSGSDIEKLIEDNKYTEIRNILQTTPQLIKKRFENNKTLLHIASEKNRPEIVQFLLDNGAEIDLRDDRSRTPLVAGVISNSIESVELLLSNKAGINVKDAQSFTPLHYAAFKGNSDIVHLLLVNGAQVDIKADLVNGATPLFLAVQKTNIAASKELIDHGANINIKIGPISLLNFAITKNNLDLVSLLIENGANINDKGFSNGRTPLHLAVIMGSVEIMNLLIKKNVNIDPIDDNGYTPLNIAVKYGNKNVYQICHTLIKAGANINSHSNNGSSPILNAVNNGYKDILGELIKNNAMLTEKYGDNKLSLLDIAAIRGHQEIVKILLSTKSEFEVKDNEGRSPIFYSKKYGNKKIAEILNNKYPSELEQSDSIESKITDAVSSSKSIIWKLDNRGWVLKTKSHFLIIDAEDFGISPDEPSLFNGHIIGDEINNFDVVSIFTTYHGEIGDPATIHKLERDLKKVTYIQNSNDSWRGSEKTIYMKENEDKILDGINITSFSMFEEGLTLGYIIEIDGLKVFISGFYGNDIESFSAALKKIKNIQNVDIAFVFIEPMDWLNSILKILNPKMVLLSDPNNRIELFPDIKENIEKNFKGTQVFFAEFPGDNIIYP